MMVDSYITIVGRMVSLPFLFLTFYYYWHATELRYLYRMCFMNYLGFLVVSNFWNIWALFNEYHNVRPTHISLSIKCLSRDSLQGGANFSSINVSGKETHNSWWKVNDTTYIVTMVINGNTLQIVHIYNFIEFSIILWTNVLCFDFWQSIKNLLPYNSVNRREIITYIKYLIYVWSTSILYTIVGCINDYLLGSNQRLQEIIRWLSFAYIVIILLSNVLMMIRVTIIIVKEIRAIKQLNTPDTAKNENDHKTKLMLYCKLVLVTIFMICSKWFWFRLDNILHKKGTTFMYKCLMAGNSFQGVFIYFLFAFKTKEKHENKTRTSGLSNDQTKSSELKSQSSTSSKV